MLRAQALYPVRKQTDTIPFTVVSENGRLAIAVSDALPILGKRSGELPQLRNLYLNDAHLALEYRYPKLERGMTYKIRLSLLRDYGLSIHAEEWDLSTTELKDSERTRRLQWLDRTEKGLYYGQSYALELERLLLSTVDCDAERPEWGTDDQWPYWMTALVGGVGVVLGQDQRMKKEDQYREYEERWEAGRPLTDAQPFYDRASEHQARSRWFTGLGWGVLAINAVLWARKRQRTKSEQRIYDTYCAPESNSLTLVPVWDHHSRQWVAGLHFNASF